MFRAVVYVPIGSVRDSGRPRHTLGYQSLVFFREEEARAYEHMSRTQWPTLFSPVHRAHGASLVEDGRLVAEHAEYVLPFSF